MKLIANTSAILALIICWSLAIGASREFSSVQLADSQLAVLSTSSGSITSPVVWSEIVAQITDSEIKHLLEKKENRDLVKKITENLLYSAITGYRAQLKSKLNRTSSVGEFFETATRAVVFDAFVDLDALNDAVPSIATDFVSKLDEPDLKSQIKDALLTSTSASVGGLHDLRSQRIAALKQSIDCSNIEMCFDAISKRRTAHEANALWLSAALVLVLTIITAVQRRDRTYREGSPMGLLLTVWSLSALALLVPAIVVPMLKLSAFIEPFTLQVGSGSFSFEQQTLLYQNKSILNLLSLLVQSGKINLLVLAVGMVFFCLILPTLKTLSSIVSIFKPEITANNSAIHWLAFSSSKWSMTDVLVVAFLMAVIGMDQLVSSHVAALNELLRQSQLLVASSSSNLGAGFYFFVGFVFLSFLISDRTKAYYHLRIGAKSAHLNPPPR